MIDLATHQDDTERPTRSRGFIHGSRHGPRRRGNHLPEVQERDVDRPAERSAQVVLQVQAESRRGVIHQVF